MTKAGEPVQRPETSGRRISPEVGAALRLVAPGTVLRAGLDRILQMQQGALILLAGPGLEDMRSGGFPFDEELTEQKLSEMSKMDGAIVLSPDGARIIWANVQLMPEPNIPTQETGTRHRTAERTARQLGTPVIAVSEDMRTIGLYVGSETYRLQSIAALLQRADQALSTLARYRVRLDDVFKNLSQLELQDLVTLEEVGDALSSYEVVRRVAEEVQGYVLELGVDGRLLGLQLDELMAGVVVEAKLLISDYCRPARPKAYERALSALAAASDDDLWASDALGRVLGLPESEDSVELDLSPRGYRLLSKIPRIPPSVAEGLVRRFENLQRLRKASIEELMDVEGVGETRARSIANGLERLADSGLL